LESQNLIVLTFRGAERITQVLAERSGWKNQIEVAEHWSDTVAAESGAKLANSEKYGRSPE
jgi:hypothetical protein